MNTPKLRTALWLSSSIAVLGYRRRALSASGAAGAVLVGASTYRAGGWRWSALLLTFFASSSALSRRKSVPSDDFRSSIFGRPKIMRERSAIMGKSSDKDLPSPEAIAAMNERGSRRDVVQVLANGGVASALALSYVASPGGDIATGFAGAMAAANADTWATEIGGASSSPPRQILTGAVVPPGTSGGVTVRGLLGAVGGAAAIGLASGVLHEGRSCSPMGKSSAKDLPYRSLVRGIVVATAGLAGSLIDSVVGGTLQASYRCPRCGEPTERRVHNCGMPTVLVRGYAWCTNDVVNVVCTGAGGAGALIAEWILDRNR